MQQGVSTGISKSVPWRDYLALCKPKVVLLLLITAWIAMLLATPSSILNAKMWLALLGIGCAASSAAVINHLVDINIDRKMSRTKQRPLSQRRISVGSALAFSASLGIISMTILIVYINWLTAVLSLAGLFGYAFIYTIYLKHATSQNIVFGGLAGALPPLLGWTSMTNSVDVEALLLVLIIFVWTPAHFWPLAIDRVNDYTKADVPMLPVTHGIEYTKNSILVYSLMLVVASITPYWYGMSGVWYLVSAIGLGAYFCYHALLLKFKPRPSSAMKTFFASIVYLFLLFIALLADRVLANAASW